ncbi:TonB-dependent receptor [Tamlana fucoidanivorans]|uniref:TonB-dependent receptor n=1 Tax=Allotamlana fucoidanivorans TaxID=2583814 RepID=A0A5C4SRK2_9FLAO|nr:TonB-dependent receptor [Tamlana fucoidanivorans]TNJ47033.1 TonB-dependent receptor [Tamlana fucoidanivorans]
MKKQITLFLRRSFLLGALLMFMSFHHANAQQTINGTVVDEAGVGIPGANVIVKGTTTGSVTDFDGNFSISASASDVLEISFIGYVTQSITVGNQTKINVTLIEDAAELDEVVVIGYGTAKKSDLTGAVSQVSAKSFEKQPLTRVEDALSGRAAGVTVSRQGGAPGAAIKVRVRGVNSINQDNSPLVVIDGIIGGDLSTINPNDIASMDVLKDASATAIYGSRGANGVIMVTTKKGKGKSKIDVDYFTTISSVPEYLPTLNAANFARIENSRRVRVGGSPIFSDSEISDLAASGGTDYQRELFQTGLSNNVQLSASGSEGKINYFLSGNYVNEEGIVKSTGFERYSVRANVNSNIADNFKIGLNVFATRANTKNDITALNRFQGSLVVKALTWDPTTPIFDENGQYNRFSTRSLASLNQNPIEDINTTDRNSINDRLNVNFNLNWDINDAFNYTLLAGASTINNATESYVLDHPLNDVSFGNAKNTTHQVSNILTWHQLFADKHDVKVTGVYEFSGFESRWNAYNGNDLSLPLGFYLGELAAARNFNNNYSKSALESIMGRAEYIYNDVFFLTGTVRSDSSSKFRSGKRNGVFPSVSARYNFSNMLGEGDTFTGLSLRAGWGQVGNENIAPYTTFPTVTINSTYAFDGANVQPGSAPDGYGNPDLTWETTTQTNVGVDLGLFNGRANLSLDYYVKNTEDLLLDVPVPDTNGGGFIKQNLGEIENKGFDISLNGTIIQNDNFNWNSVFTFSYVKNKVIDLGDVDEIQGSFESVDGQQRRWNRIQVGEPIGQFWGATFLGTWKSTDNIPVNETGEPIAIPGDAKYLLDDDNNLVFGVIGNGTPNTFWGFNNTLTYKNWDFNVFFQGVHGFDVLNAVQGIIVGNTGNQRSFLAADQVNQWTATNETDIPAGGRNEIGSTRFVEKGDFIRLSNLSIGYTFNDLFSTIDYLKLYASGQNLFLITDYTGYDPEHTSRPANNAGNVDVAAGINVGAYPNPRTFSLGVKFGF